MPLYEYRCNRCRHRVSILVRSSLENRIACPDCGSTELSRLFSRFAIAKSDRAVYDDILSDSRLVKGLENNDPRALAEWNRKMSGEIGEEYREMLDRMEAGEMPESLAGAKDASEEQ